MENKSGIIEYSFKYHRITLLLVIVLILTGIYGLYDSPKQDFPTFTIRQGVVIAFYPGASSEEVEEQVTKPLENYILGYKEVRKDKVFSQSKAGMSLINIELDEQIKDKDEFWSKLKHGLEAFRTTYLPAGITALNTLDEFGETSMQLIALESSNLSYKDLKQYSEDLQDKLRQVKGVTNLQNYGLLNEQICVYLNQKKLLQYNISPLTIINQLRCQGNMVESGYLKGTNQNIPVFVHTPYKNTNSLGNDVIYTDQNGRILRLRDIASISQEYPEAVSHIKNNGTKCVLLAVEVKRGTDIVKTGRKVNKILDDYKTIVPPGLNIYKITDQSEVVKTSVLNFCREIVIAVIGVLLIVVLFLSLRTAMVAALTIPITVFCALAAFYLFKIEINTIILSALIVTLGMVVDDSIVIIDNYVENLDNGMSKKNAAISSPKKYFKSVLTATLVISVTFFPFLLTTKGMFKDFLVSYPWAMTIILGFSLVIALLFTPYLQYTFINKQTNSLSCQNKIFNLIQRQYNKLLALCLEHPKITIGAGLFIIFVGFLLFFNLPLRLMPLVERNQFAVEITLPTGSSIHKTEEVADSLENILRKDKRIIAVTSFIGTGSPRFHDTYVPQLPADNFAQFIVNTKDNKATSEIIDKYSAKYSNYFPEAYVKFKQMDFSEARYPIEIRIVGKDIGMLKTYSDSIMDIMKADKRLYLVRSNFDEPSWGIDLSLNDNADRLGINKTGLASSTAFWLGNGIPATTIWQKDYAIPVIVKPDKADYRNYEDLINVDIPSPDNTSKVHLDYISEVSEHNTEGQIVRRNGIRTISILAETKRGVNEVGTTLSLKNEIEKIKLPDNMSVSYGGMYEADFERLPQIVGGLVIAIGVMFFILVFHFKKISLALLALGASMLCILGSSIGMIISNVPICVTSILGIVSLIGILLRNGIILLDYAEDLRKNTGLDVHDAAFHAGSRRLRPIFLTSMAAAIGVVPMLLEKSPLWLPLGTVIFYGTIITMIFLSVILPVTYSIVYRKKQNKY